MTSPAQVVELLSILRPQVWTFDIYGRIRNAFGQCPLCALAGEIEGRYLGSTYITPDVRGVLDLTLEDSAILASVADDTYVDEDKRTGMIEALKVKKQ